MSQQDLLDEVIVKLQQLGIEFLLSGSHASSLQGEARATHDIDLVAKLSAADATPLIQAFPADRFYLSESAVVEAIRDRRMFNVLETRTGERIDFWVLTNEPFDQSRFLRRQRIDLGEQSVDVSSPEDTILMKLLWCLRSGGSEKQFQDAVRVYELQSTDLDREYLGRWLGELGVQHLWDRLVAEAEPFLPPDGAN